MRFKSSSKLTLRDKLSRLTFVQAQKLLGPQGAHWLAMGGKIEIDTVTQVRLTDESCQISFPEAGAGVGASVGDRRDPLVVKVASARCLRVLRAMAMTRRESASFIAPDFPWPPTSKYSALADWPIP